MGDAMSLRATKQWVERHAWVRFLGSVLLLASVVVFVPRRHLLAGLQSIRLPILAAAFPLYLLLHAGGALKWHIVVNRSGAGMTGLRSLQCYFFGLFGNLFLPSVAGGDAVMVALALRKAEKRAGIVVGSFVNRAVDVAAMLMLVLGAAALLPGVLNAGNRRIFIAVLAAVGVGIALFAAAAGALRPAWFPGRLNRLLAEHQSALELLRRPRLILTPLALSLAIQFGLLALTYWIAAASGLHLSLAAWVFAWQLAKLAALLPVAVAGIGPRELALSALLAPFGAPASRTVAIVLAWDALMVSGSLVGGVVWKALGWALDPPASGRK